MADPGFKIRKATLKDVQLLFEWATDDEVRKNSISSDKILFKDHQLWLTRKLASSRCEIFILELGTDPTGQIRFDYNDLEKAWEIDYSVAKKYRGGGFAKILIQEGLRSFGRFPLSANVKTDNIVSQRVFTSLGFVNKGECVINNVTLIKFSRRMAL